MIVKLRQNFTKMREFSWIRDQKKKIVQKYLSFTRYDYVPKWEHWRFSAQTFETNSKLFISIQNNQSNQLHGTWCISHYIAAFDLRKRLLHFMHMTRVFF